MVRIALVFLRYCRFISQNETSYCNDNTDVKKMASHLTETVITATILMAIIFMAIQCSK